MQATGVMTYRPITHLSGPIYCQQLNYMDRAYKSGPSTNFWLYFFQGIWHFKDKGQKVVNT